MHFAARSKQIVSRCAGALLAIAGLLGLASSVHAVASQCFPGTILDYSPGANDTLDPALCSLYRCEPPEVSTPTYALVPPTCDVANFTCSVRATIPMHFPANHRNYPDPQGNPFATALLLNNQGSVVDVCGNPGGSIQDDYPTIFATVGVKCGDPPASSTFKLVAASCNLAGSCKKTESVALDFAAGVGCTLPPTYDCGGPEGAAVAACCFGPMGGSPAVGGGNSPSSGSLHEEARNRDGEAGEKATTAYGRVGASIAIPMGAPPEMTLRYFYGGAGAPAYPENVHWNRHLGQFWSHDFAERIVPYPDQTKVWMITKSGSFREFWTLGTDNFYTNHIPADEYRRLEWLGAGAGWVLRGLDGTLTYFRSDGLWSRTVDRNGKVAEGTYDPVANYLSAVNFPDGRSIELAYYSNGKLQSLTEVGVGGSTSRTWSYVWSIDSQVTPPPTTRLMSQNLQIITRPDGTRWRFAYDAAAISHLTRVYRDTGNGTPVRIEAAWEYDAAGSLIRTWKGAESFTDAAAVAKYSWNYFSPTETRVTDPYGNVTTYTFERDVASGKPRVTQIQGECPTCGLGPNAVIDYDNPANTGHPLKPWKITNGIGTTTEFLYNDSGRTTSRTEALQTALERTTTWDYDAIFPGFITQESRPSVVPGCLSPRSTLWTYHPDNGNLLSMTRAGCEGAGSLSLLTDYGYGGTTGGAPTSIDPPGYFADDLVTFTYDVPLRNDMLVHTRHDPLVGTTTYDYDEYNRRVGTTDPNGVLHETTYDAVDRITSQIERGEAAVPGDPIQPADLVTRLVYNSFGDLFCRIRPRGNAEERVYDAAGRLTEVRRGTAVASPTATLCLDVGQPRERMIYTLDGFGHHTRQKLERDEAGGGEVWVTHADTLHTYSSRCHLDAMTQAPGRTEASTTSYVYDCNGNLEKAWDPMRDQATFPSSPTTRYVHDELDRLREVHQLWGKEGAGEPTEIVTYYGYDGQDHLDSVTDAEGNTTTYETSDRDLLTKEISPVSGTTTHEYTDHGQLWKTSDARFGAVTTTRTVDAADRVTNVDYPGSASDAGFIFGLEGETDFSVGRLRTATRGGLTQSYGYDRFGRMLQDGALALTYDTNGNRQTATYPGSLLATYGFDFADREISLSIREGTGPTQTVVGPASGTSYRAFGPLSGLSFGTNPAHSETRSFDFRNAPASIAVSGSLLGWTYSTDRVGNPTFIDDTTAANLDRTFTYQPHQYFLMTGSGPWGDPLAWSYDRIGNRLGETRGAATDTYTYAPNGGGGHSALLDLVTLNGGGSRDYTFDAGGFLDRVDAGANTVDFVFDSQGALVSASRPSSGERVDFEYDPRGLLRWVGERPLLADDFEGGNAACWSAANGGLPAGSCASPAAQAPIYVAPVYDSGGRLMLLERRPLAGADLERHAVLYFAGRPVGLWHKLGSAGGTLQFITTDHLGTPSLALDAAGAVAWSGGFEPFGTDFQAGLVDQNNHPLGASENGVFLRLPGQWIDPVWYGATLGAQLYQNAFRWYEPATGRYTSPDPVGIDADIALYRYAYQSPLRFVDPSGLYGTNDCSYYDSKCDQCGGNYYCIVAPAACNSFPKYPDPDPGRSDDFEGWSRCTRQCLQDCDTTNYEDRKRRCGDPCNGRSAANPDPETDSFWSSGNRQCHTRCYVLCHVWGTWGHGDPIPGIGTK